MRPMARLSLATQSSLVRKARLFFSAAATLPPKTAFGCTTCHDPHRALDTVTAHYETKCLSCHRRGELPIWRRRLAASQGNLLVSGRVCPVNSKDNCISCHMPSVEEPARKSRFTDHHIRVHRDLGPGRAASIAH